MNISNCQVCFKLKDVLTSKWITNNICPVRHMNFKRNYRWLDGHEKQFTYYFRLVV